MLALGGRISGTVRDLCGRVMPGAAVSAISPESTARTTTDGTGRYLFELEPGTWTVTYELTGFRSHRQKILIAGPNDSIEMDVRLPDDGPRVLTRTHQPNVVYQNYHVQGVVRSKDGAGIPQAIVRLRPRRPNQFVVANQVCTTDSDGRYFVKGWSTEPVRWVLSVESQGYRSYASPDLDLTEDEPRTLEISLEPR
jgi:hypothetical protein